VHGVTGVRVPAAAGGLMPKDASGARAITHNLCPSSFEAMTVTAVYQEPSPSAGYWARRRSPAITQHGRTPDLSVIRRFAYLSVPARTASALDSALAAQPPYHGTGRSCS